MARFVATQNTAGPVRPDVTWRRGIWLLLLAALLVKGKLLYVLLYTLVLTYVLSRQLLDRGFNAVRCTREIPVDHVFVGEEVDVTIHLENRSRIPLLWVMATDETSHNVTVAAHKRAVVSLGAREKKSYTYRVAGRRRGLHAIGPIRLEAGDAFGIGHLHGRVDIRSPLIVYPRIHQLGDLGLPSTLPFGDVQTTRRFFDDPAHAVGARQYHPGDPFKSVHWKLTARTGELHVKEYQPTIAVDTAVLLNLNEAEYEVHLLEHYSELAIEVAASIASNLVQRRQSVGLATNGRGSSVVPHGVASPPQAAGIDDPPGGVFLHPRKGGAGLMRILELLAMVECAPTTPFVSLLSNTATRLNWGATLILVTPVDSPELLQALLSLRRTGFNLIVIVVGFAPVHPQYLYRPLAPGVTFFHVRSPSEVEALGVAPLGSYATGRRYVTTTKRLQ